MDPMGFELTEQIERHLISDQIAWLTTVTPSGRPAPRPVWFVWDGSEITVYSLNGSAKQRHIAANDKVSVNFDSGPGGGDVVVISARARLVPGAPPPSRFPGLLDKYLPAIEAMGSQPQWYDDNYSEAIRITPESAWTFPA
jgi:PPOX class probable F420-dependent enzyme